jgi:hypothetical protein
VQFTDPTAAFSLNSANATTSNSQLDASYNLAAAIDLSVSTSSAASSVTASYPLSDGTTATLNMTSSGLNWTATIPLGAGPVTAGNLPITFSGTSTGGATATASTAVVLQAPSLGAIEIVGLSISPVLCTTNSSPYPTHFASSITAEVKNVSATTGTVTIKVGSLAVATATPTGSVGASGGQLFRITLAANTSLPTTPVTITVNATRSEDGASSSRDFSQTVKRKNSSNAC